MVYTNEARQLLAIHRCIDPGSGYYSQAIASAPAG